MAPQKQIAVRIAAVPKDGFYRGGRKWPHKAITVEVTQDELAVLKAERMLSVVEFHPSAPGPDEKVIGELKLELVLAREENAILRAQLKEAADRITALKASGADAQAGGKPVTDAKKR